MSIDWNLAKRLSNLAKHGVDFASVEFFEWDAALVRASLRGNEPRLEAYGPIAGRLHVLVFSVEAGAVASSACAKANKEEFARWINEA